MQVLSGRSNWNKLLKKQEDTDAGRKRRDSIQRVEGDDQRSAKKRNADAAAPFVGSTTRKVLALDCEMVAAGPISMLCRVVVVDFTGTTLLDTWVAPEAPVTDYRTEVSAWPSTWSPWLLLT
jgi:hypothetical protein